MEYGQGFRWRRLDAHTAFPQRTSANLQRYNATNNELLRTQTLVKSAIVDVDATPFRQWYEAHYAQPIYRGAKLAEESADKKQSNHVKRILDERKKDAKIDPILEQQFKAGRLLAIITSRPGQSGRADGYILEGKELDVSATFQNAEGLLLTT
jgi:small subunit ribosomal protein S8e